MFVACNVTCKQRGDSCGCLWQFVSKPHALISKRRFKRTTLHWFPHLAVRIRVCRERIDPVLSVCVCALWRALPVLWKADVEETGLYVSELCVIVRSLQVLHAALSTWSCLHAQMPKEAAAHLESARLHIKPCCSVFIPLHSFNYLPDRRILIYSKSCSEGNQFVHVSPFNKDMPKCWKTNPNTFF